MLISDNVHDCIEYTNLERKILSSPIFNRLHNIRQNSTAYLTYPSNRISRFIHSLGVMHLSSEVYLNSITQAVDLEKNRPLSPKEISEQIKKIIEFIVKGDNFEKVCCDCLNKGAWAKMAESFGEDTENPNWSKKSQDFKMFTEDKFFLDKFSPVFEIEALKSMEKQFRYHSNLLQSLRIAALFHDIGHPPYSHAVEFCFEDILRAKGMGYVKHYYDILDAIEDFAVGPLKEKKKFHESLGVHFLAITMHYILYETLGKEKARLKKQEVRIEEVIQNYLLIESLAISILAGKLVCYDLKGPKLKLFEYSDEKNMEEVNSFLGMLRDIIASEFDADRLDYVFRDMAASTSTKMEISTRIIKNFHFLRVKDVNQKVNQKVLPSLKVLNEVECLLDGRAKSYKYIVFHHNVAKMDALLTHIIRELSKIDKIKKDEKIKVEKAKNIKTQVYNIWSPFYDNIDLSKSGVDSREDVLIKVIEASLWEESWLDHTLKWISFKLRNFETKNDGFEFTELRLMIEEFVYNQRNFTSLWKRYSEYVECLNSAFSVKHLEDMEKLIIELLDSMPSDKQEMLKADYKERKTRILSLKNNSTAEKFNFFFSEALKRFVNKGKFEDELEEGLREKSLSQSKDKYILMAKVLPAVSFLSKDFRTEIYDEKKKKIVELAKYSPIINHIYNVGLKTPQFYVYIAKIGDSGLEKIEEDEDILKKIKDKIGDITLEALTKSVEASLEEMY